MKNEMMGSIYSKILIDNLLHVYALTNMYGATGNEEYRKSASGWISNIERTFDSLKRELLGEES
jgi:uncharacterized protein YyaL (SSP411 family)